MNRFISKIRGLVTAYGKTTGLVLLGVVTIYITSFLIDVATTPPTTADNHRAAAQHLTTNSLPQPPNAFTTDGCTAWPDFLLWHDFYDACIEHDIAYWAGGTNDQKYAADLELRDNVRHTGVLGPVFGTIMFVGVHVFGDNIMSEILGSNWGYGWNE